MKEKGYASIALLTIGLIFVGSLSAFFILSKVKVQKGNSITSISGSQKSASFQEMTKNNTPLPSSKGDEVSDQLFKSLDGKYFFYFYSESDYPGPCKYYVRDTQFKRYDISDLIGSKEINCEYGLGSYHTKDFYGWADEGRFILENSAGEIKIVNIVNRSAEKYLYDPKNYEFVQVNKSLKYWLFRNKISLDDKVSFVVLDENKDITKNDLIFGSKDWGSYGLSEIFYDPVNDGFLFISRKYTDKLLTVKFDFLALNNLTLRTILVTDPVTWSGRGCPGDHLVSDKVDEVAVEGICLIVDKKYRSQDGNIRIKL